MAFTWESGKTTNSTGKADFISKMVPITRGPSVRAMRLARDAIFTTTDAFTREELRIIKHMAMEAIVIPIKGIAMKEIGSKTYLQEMANKNFPMDHTTKDHSRMELKTAKEDTFQIQVYIKEISKMENLMGRGALLT